MAVSGGERNPIGLAVVGCGRVGRIRARCAREYPGTEWLGLCDIDEKKGRAMAGEFGADFFTTDFAELIRRPEVNAVVIATDEEWHAGPLWEAIGRGHRILVEKPLATSVAESARIVAAAEAAGAELLVGYTQRFRRRWLTAREHVQSGILGEITSATTRALLNRQVGITRLSKNEDRSMLTPMVISGTHALDVMLFVMGLEKKPAEVVSRSISRVMTGIGTQDATFSIFTFEDGAIWSMECNWGMPTIWPASTYGVTISVVGAEGALTIDDTHADFIMASENPLASHRGEERHVHLLESYPAGDMSRGQFWGPMRDESIAWLSPPLHGRRHAPRHGGGGAQKPHALHGVRPVRQAQRSREAAHRPRGAGSGPQGESLKNSGAGGFGFMKPAEDEKRNHSPLLRVGPSSSGRPTVR